MKNLTTALCAIAASFTLSAQTDIESQLEELYQQDQYDKIINKYAGKKDELSATSLYFVGKAYYMKDREDKSIEFMDLSIAKDSTRAEPYYIKGQSYNYKQMYIEAVPCLEKAIGIDATNPRFYTALADSYYFQDMYTEALAQYHKAILLPECEMRPFFIVGVIYLDKKETDKALQYFLAAKEKAVDNPGAYADILFNIGLIYVAKNDYTQAEAVYSEAIAVSPEDYHTYAKLMQVYYHRGEYDKAKPLRDKLYEASRSGRLAKDESPVEYMFCYDQFKWGNYKVMAFERYETGPKRVAYDKHLFYFIPDGQEDAALKVVTKYLPGSEENGKLGYEFCADKGSLHFESGIAATVDTPYETLKAGALKLAEEHLE